MRMESKVSLLFIHFHKLRILKKRHGNPSQKAGFPWRFSLTRIVFGYPYYEHGFQVRIGMVLAQRDRTAVQFDNLFCDR